MGYDGCNDEKENMMWLKNVEGCGEGCVWLATIADKVVRDVDPNAGLL